MADTPLPRLGSPSRDACSGTTAWSRGRVEFLRSYLADHRSGTLIVLGAMICSLLWADLASHTYLSFWSTELSVSIGRHVAELSTRA
jgi:hypothetical protein